MPVSMLPVFLMVASLASVEGFRKGSCLGYDVLCTTANYQLRRYKESVWVGINVNRLRVTRQDTAPLHHYFRWKNSEGMKIQLSGQALVSFTWPRELAIYLMLPEELWDNPPAPTNPRVFITHFPMMDVFTRISHSFALNDVGDFNRTLTAQNLPVNNSNFFVYFCLGDEVVFERLRPGGDIWFVATGGFECPAP